LSGAKRQNLGGFLIFDPIRKFIKLDDNQGRGMLLKMSGG
jgi:hypothetical protein